MKILWVTNVPCGALRKLADNQVESGSWLDAALNGLRAETGLELIIATTSRVKEMRVMVEDGITYCLLPGGYPIEYDHTAEENRRSWKAVRDRFCPDVLQVWGTEFSHGYLALQVMKDIPSVIFMQGVLRSIARHYTAGMSEKELRSSVTLRDLIKRDWIGRQQQKYQKRALIEAEMIRLSGNVIAENEWCIAQCRAIDPDCRVHQCELSIRDDFFDSRWNAETMIPYTMMSNAAGYPVKGLHVVIRALSLVVRTHPQARLFVAGEESPFEINWRKKLKAYGYRKHIISLITELGLQNKIVFLGHLSTSQMAEQLAKSNVFVMPSSIENHSSSLIEAMIVGVPCVASYVGGIPEYVTHNENGLLYRFDEYEMLASHLCRIFDDQAFACTMASKAYTAMRSTRGSMAISEKLADIYLSLSDHVTKTAKLFN